MLAQLDAMQARAQQVNLEMQRLQQGFQESAERGLAQFFQEIGAGSKSAGEAFKAMVKSIIDDMRRLLAEMLARQIIGSLFKTIFGTATGSVGGQTPGNTTPSGGRASGGPARPAHGRLYGGTSGKDSIPIMAMPEEWFIRREAVRHYGDDFMQMINSMQLPRVLPRKPMRFAEGGGVPRMEATARPGVAQEHVHRIMVTEDGLLKFMNGQRGKGIVLGHVRSAPRMVTGLARQLKRN
jgi:hypothetical protein